jgi:hypothetical protein
LSGRSNRIAHKYSLSSASRPPLIA